MIKFFLTDEDRRMHRVDAFVPKCWIDLVNPTDDEVEDAAAVSGMPEEMLKAALDEEETARLERDEDVTMFLVDTPTISETEEGEDAYETIPLALLYNENCVVTVSLHGNPVLGDFIAGRVGVTTQQPMFFILSFMMGNAKRFLSNLRQIDKKSLRVQAELHRSMKNKELIQMMGLENSLVYFSTSLSSNMSVYTKMERLSAIANNEDYKDMYDDMLIETRQAVEMCNIYRDIISGTMDAYASVISNNLNVVMKLFAVITFIIAIPTFIASLWGMNVDVPFAGTAWGFWVVLGLCVVITVVSSVFIIRYANSIKIKTSRPKRRRRGMHD